MHLFDLYRRFLLIVLAVYAVARAAQAVLGWRQALAGEDRQRRLARRYVQVLLFSVRLRRFWRELVHIVLLLMALLALVLAHGYVM